MWYPFRGRFQQRRRLIFKYWDGRRTRYADPIVLLRNLEDHPEFNIDVDPTLALSSVGDREAGERTVSAVRAAFGIFPFVDVHSFDGLTELECVALYVEFMEYLDALKKNGSRPPTPPGPSGPEPSDILESDTVITNATSVSG